MVLFIDYTNFLKPVKCTQPCVGEFFYLSITAPESLQIKITFYITSLLKNDLEFHFQVRKKPAVQEMCSWQDPRHAWLGPSLDKPLVPEACSTIHLGIAHFAVALSATAHVCAGRVRDGHCVPVCVFPAASQRCPCGRGQQCLSRIRTEVILLLLLLLLS